MPFTNAILGGNTLIREEIKSPDYVPGVSGWSIKRDGTVEFNDGVFRGDVTVNSLIAGDPDGARIEITSDGLFEVYNGDGQLFTTITPANGVTVQASDGGYVDINVGSDVVGETANIYFQSGTIVGESVEPGRITARNNVDLPVLEIYSPVIDTDDTGDQSVIRMYGTSGDGSSAPSVHVQTDEVTVNSSNIVVDIQPTIMLANYGVFFGETGSFTVSNTGTSWNRTIPFNATFVNAPTFVIANIASPAGATSGWFLKCDSITTSSFRVLGNGPSATWTNVPITWAAFALA